MWKYTIFILIGILIFLLLNRYNTFSVGAVLKIPLGTNLAVDQINFRDAENVAHTPVIHNTNMYHPINQIYLENGDYYYYVDINIEDLRTCIPDDLIDIINRSIETFDPDRQEREEREGREIYERGRDRQDSETTAREEEEKMITIKRLEEGKQMLKESCGIYKIVKDMKDKGQEKEKEKYKEIDKKEKEKKEKDKHLLLDGERMLKICL